MSRTRSKVRNDTPLSETVPPPLDKQDESSVLYRAQTICAIVRLSEEDGFCFAKLLDTVKEQNKKVKVALLKKVKENDDEVIHKVDEEIIIDDTDILREIFEWDFKTTAAKAIYRIYPFVIKRLKKFSENFKRMTVNSQSPTEEPNEEEKTVEKDKDIKVAPVKIRTSNRLMQKFLKLKKANGQAKSVKEKENQDTENLKSEGKRKISEKIGLKSEVKDSGAEANLNKARKSRLDMPGLKKQRKLSDNMSKEIEAGSNDENSVDESD